MSPMDKRDKIIKLYCDFYIISNLIIGLITIINYKSLGEAEGLIIKLSRVDLALVLALNSITFYISYIFFIKTKNLRFSLGKKLKTEINSHKVHMFFMMIVIVRIIFTIFTGNSVVNRTETSTPFDFIVNAVKVDSFFPIYYVVCRDTSKKSYWINIILYIFWQIICGWSGVILTVAFLEVYFRTRHGNGGDIINKIAKYKYALLIIFFTVGSYMYSILFSIKNSIRYQYSASKLSWLEGMEQLLMRISNYSTSVVGIQNHKSIALLYRSQGINNIELKSIFRTILPGFVMDKKFRTMGNELVHSMYKDIGMYTSTEYNPFIRCFNLIEADFSEFIVLAIVCILLLIFSKVIIDSLDTGTHDTDILYFLLILQIACGGSAESIFGYGYLGLIYFIPIMILFGVASVKLE